MRAAAKEGGKLWKAMSDKGEDEHTTQASSRRPEQGGKGSHIDAQPCCLCFACPRPSAKQPFIDEAEKLKKKYATTLAEWKSESHKTQELALEGRPSTAAASQREVESVSCS